MRTAGAEGFGPALHGVDLEDAGNDEDVGSKNTGVGCHFLLKGGLRNKDVNVALKKMLERRIFL